MRAGALGGRSGGGEDEHPPQVPHHGHEAPLDAHFVETAQRKLAESERRLDDAQHRLRRLLAQSLEVAAFGRLFSRWAMAWTRVGFSAGPSFAKRWPSGG
jgi:hypothetical protein